MTGLAYLGVFILVMCVFFPIVGWPAGLFWLAIIPIAAFVWVLRTQTKVSPAGLDLRTVFSSRHIGWEGVRGVAIPKRGYVRVHLDDDSEVALPAVSYDRLRDLVDASGGRIPDPFALPDPDTPADTADRTPDDTADKAPDETADKASDDTADQSDAGAEREAGAENTTGKRDSDSAATGPAGTETDPGTTSGPE
ncbi:PH domain-containing protein [Nocardia sp. NBC_00416]|uniref:PH domain-containing protein n=1 Tax=Nocardia sp. NBC_00416 TaxID=2975991 RepID=UPI002E225B07